MGIGVQDEAASAISGGRDEQTPGERVPGAHSWQSIESKGHVMDMSKSRVKAFRPWGIDALAVIKKATHAALTVSYDHSPDREYVLPRREADVIGRVVFRDTLERTSI